MRDASLGRRCAEKLFQVWQHDGSPQMVLIHVEAQGQRDPEFPERMYVYNYHPFDRYRCLVLSLAVLADTSRTWRPDRIQPSSWGIRCCASFSWSSCATTGRNGKPWKPILIPVLW